MHAFTELIVRLQLITTKLKPIRMPFFSLSRSPPPLKSGKYKASPTAHSQGKTKGRTLTGSTVSESYPDTDELTLDGMTLSGLTLGNDTVSTVNLDSVIRRSVNLGGDHDVSPEISIRKSPSSASSNSNYKPRGFRPLNTDDIDERIQAYRHAVTTYREREQLHQDDTFDPISRKHAKSKGETKTKTFYDKMIEDEYTLPGLSLGGDSASHHEPRARAVFRPVVDSSKRSKAAAATMSVSSSKVRKGVDVQNALNARRSVVNETRKASPKYIAPTVEPSRTSDWSEKENGSNSSSALGRGSLTSNKSRNTSSTQTTRTTKNGASNKAAVPCPPSSVSMKISPMKHGSSSKHQSTLDPFKPALRNTKKQAHSSGLPAPYSNFPDDEGLYDDPPLLPIEDSFASSNGSPVKGSETDESNASFSIDLDVAVNPSDKELMEREGVSGALRLTPEGLQEHDRLMNGTMHPKAMETASLHGAHFNNWSKHIEQAKKDFARSRASAGSGDNENPVQMKAKATGSSPVATKSLTQSSPESTGKTGPTNVTATAKRTVSSTASPAGKDLKQKKKKKKGLGIFACIFGSRKASPSSTLSQDLREQGREAESQRQHLKEAEELREAERIESKRQAYLEVARQKEATAFQLPSNLGNASTLGEASIQGPPLPVIEEFDDDCSVPFDTKPPPKKPLTDPKPANLAAPVLKPCQSADSGITSSSSSLPPCIVCRQGERTHISTPCMHFAFCGNCVDQLQVKGTCPVCARTDVGFAQVSV